LPFSAPAQPIACWGFRPVPRRCRVTDWSAVPAAWNGDCLMQNWPDRVKELSILLRDLRGGAPEIMKAFSGIAQAALTQKALDRKTKELIALAIAVAVK